jgi:tetratricopeptide (TPR) repeat protein
LNSGGTDSAGYREKAFKQLKRALALTAHEPDLFLAIAEWCERLRQTDQAFEAYQRALQLDATLAVARQGLQRLKPEQAPKVILSAIRRNFKKLNHYQILGVDSKASRGQIHGAYRDLSKQFHPDRFFENKDPELPGLAREIFKRMVEAFMLLKDSERRKAYDETLLSIPKGTAHGGSPAASAPRPTGPTTRQGKKFFDLAMAALHDKKIDTAKLNLKLALQAEPDNGALRKKLDEISR